MNTLQQAKKAQGLKKFFADVTKEPENVHSKQLEFLKNGCVKTFVTQTYGGCNER